MPPDRNGARSCGSHCGGWRVHVVGAPVALPVDEEAGCAGDTARVCARNIFLDAAGIPAPPKLFPEAFGIESQGFGMGAKIRGREFVLVGEQSVMHLPKRA